MKFLKGIFFSLLIGWSSPTYGSDNFKAQYIKPLNVKILSRNDKGEIKTERFACTPQTCCFSQSFYCFMENGRCICDLHVCNQWPDKKSYWMEISGAAAERYCGRARALHELTTLCLCDPNKDSPCDECNPPCTGFSYPGAQSTLPQDCSP